MAKILCKHCGRKIKLESKEAAVMNCPLCGGLIAFAANHSGDDDVPVRPIKKEQPEATREATPEEMDDEGIPLDALSAPPDQPVKRIRKKHAPILRRRSNLGVWIGVGIAALLIFVCICSYYGTHPYTEIQDRHGKVRYQEHMTPERAEQLRQQLANEPEEEPADPTQNPD